MIFKIMIELVFLVIPYVCALSPLSLTKPVNDGFGVNIHFTHPKAGELEMIANAGFKWVRMDFFWGSTEKVKGVYNFSDYEFLLSELGKYNMSAYFILAYGNTLYKESKAVQTEPGRKAYAQWSATAVDHFKGHGIVWEIWNEPNGDGFWNNHRDVHQYIAMALEAMKAIRAKTPNEIVIGPATSQVDLGFLEDCFRAGLLNYWDAVSVHPYRQTGPEKAESDYFQLRSLVAKYAPKGKTVPIVSGEWGYSTVWYNFNSTIQGKYIQRELLTNVMNNIPISIWYDWHDDGVNKTDPEHHFGIVENEYHLGKSPVYTPKDAYLAAKTMISALKGFQYFKRIPTNDQNDYVLLFRNGHDLRLVVWSTTAKLHNITIPSDKCDFEIIHHKGEPRERTSSNGSGLTLALNDFTHFIIVKGPNHALENAPDSDFFRISIEPIHGITLSIRINNIFGIAVNGTLRLTDLKGIQSRQFESQFQFHNEYEKFINFQLKSKPDNEFTVGLRVEGHGNLQNVQTQKYVFLPNQLISDLIIIADGDPKVKSEQFVSIHSAPDPLFDSDLPVLEIDYHFYGQGSKFLNIFPNKIENRKISGQPKAFGVWVYGDNQMMAIKMRIDDSSHQTFQIIPDSRITIDWKGWRYVVFNLNNIDSHWGGSNDGIYHFPIELGTLFLLENQKQSNIKSTIYITSPLTIY